MITPSLAAARRRRRRNENELVGRVRHGHFLTDSRDKSGSCKGGRGFVTQYRRCECRPGRHSTPPTNSCRGRALQRLEQRLEVSSVFVDYRVEPDFYTRRVLLSEQSRYLRARRHGRKGSTRLGHRHLSLF